MTSIRCKFRRSHCPHRPPWLRAHLLHPVAPERRLLRQTHPGGVEETTGEGTRHPPPPPERGGRGRRQRRQRRGERGGGGETAERGKRRCPEAIRDRVHPSALLAGRVLSRPSLCHAPGCERHRALKDKFGVVGGQGGGVGGADADGGRGRRILVAAVLGRVKHLTATNTFQLKRRLHAGVILT